MSGFQIVTGDAWDSERQALVRIGIRHQGRFVAVCEGFGPWPADSFALVALNEATGAVRHLSVLGVQPIEEYDQVAFGVRMPPGVWVLQAHSAATGQVVASRKIVQS